MSNLLQAQNAILTELVSAARDLSRAADQADSNARTVRDSLARGLNIPTLARAEDLDTMARRVNSLSRVASLSGVPLDVLVAAVQGDDGFVYDWLAKQV